MSEIVDGKKVFTLSELAASIQRAFGTYYNQNYWLKAEISKLNFFGRSGHCYPELSETNDGNISAAFTGFIRRDIYKALNAKFLSTIGEPLHDGMKVVAQCSVHFSTTRGVRLTINDIDINAILGEQARLRMETVNRLKSEGVFARNKTLSLPRIIKNIAIISVESGKGYADFMSIISTTNGFHIGAKLFPALMMGPESAKQMTSALEQIEQRASDFDAVCIIRGGGGENTLQCFNDLTLCRKIALFPLPVMAGIGHATNRTVAEEVANISSVSPSELANFLIDRYSGEVAKFRTLTNKIALLLKRSLQSKSSALDAPVKAIHYKYKVVFRRKMERIDGAKNAIRQKINNIFVRRRYALHSIASRIAVASNGVCQKCRQRVETIEQQVHGVTVKQIPILSARQPQMRMAAEPVGGVCIMRDKQVINNISELHEGDVIRIITADGAAIATISAIEPNK